MSTSGTTKRGAQSSPARKGFATRRAQKVSQSVNLRTRLVALGDRSVAVRAYRCHQRMQRFDVRRKLRRNLGCPGSRVAAHLRSWRRIALLDRFGLRATARRDTSRAAVS